LGEHHERGADARRDFCHDWSYCDWQTNLRPGQWVRRKPSYCWRAGLCPDSSCASNGTPGGNALYLRHRRDRKRPQTSQSRRRGETGLCDGECKYRWAVLTSGATRRNPASSGAHAPRRRYPLVRPHRHQAYSTGISESDRGDRCHPSSIPRRQVTGVCPDVCVEFRAHIRANPAVARDASTASLGSSYWLFTLSKEFVCRKKPTISRQLALAQLNPMMRFWRAVSTTSLVTTVS